MLKKKNPGTYKPSKKRDEFFFLLYIRILKFRERGNWQYLTILIFNSTLSENMF